MKIIDFSPNSSEKVLLADCATPLSSLLIVDMIEADGEPAGSPGACCAC